MWASHLFNRANPKPLVLAQAVKLCHYTRASQRPSAEGSSLWETVYPLLRVLLSGVSCNVTFVMTWGLRLGKYRCCSRSEGSSGVRVDPRQSHEERSTMGLNDAAQEMCAPPTSRRRLCVLSTHREGKKEEKYTLCRKQALWTLKEENSTKPEAQELRARVLETTLNFGRMFRWSEKKEQKKYARLMLCICYNLYVNVTVSFIFSANTISGLPQWSLCLSKVHFYC